MANNNENKILNVPNLRFPEFSGEWEKTRLGDNCNIQMCKRIMAVQTNTDGGVPFYKIGTIGGKADAYISKDLFDEYKAKYSFPHKGEVMITCAGTVGKCIIYNGEDSYYQDSNIVWIDNPKEIISNDFLYHLLSKINWSHLNSTTIVRIYNDDLRNLKLYYPIHDEQKKITNFLSLINKRIATQNKIIEDLKKLKSAITDLLLHSIADAHTIRLGEIAHITNGVGDVQDANTEHQEDWYPFFDRSEELKWFPTYSFDKEAVIYAGEGQSFYPRYYNGKFALHQRCYAITDFASCIIPKYCYHFMNTLNSYFVRNSVGSTVPSWRMDIFQKVEIRLPPIPKQQYICKIIDAFYTKLEVEQRGISTLQELKQFLLSQIFI